MSKSQSDTISTAIRNFLLLHIRVTELTNNDDIFEQGLVNSLFAMQIVIFVESQFNLTVENDELDLKNFNSISSMTKFIETKHQANT
jgi:acyl carrier protein